MKTLHLIAWCAFLAISSTNWTYADLEAIQRADNDFATDDNIDGTRVPVPVKVAQKINALAEEDFVLWNANKLEPKSSYTKKDFIGPIYKITAPGKRAVYVYRSHVPLGSDCYHFIIYEPSTNQCTVKPPNIYSKWMDGDWGAHLAPPLIHFEDFDGDGQAEMVIQERTHNGTVYNAVLFHYYRLNKDLSTTHVLACETELFDLQSENRNGLIKRQLFKVSKNCMRVEVFTESSEEHPIRTKIGEYFLERPKLNDAFRITRRSCLASKYSNLLVTGGEVDEDAFLRDGYRMYY